VKIVCISDTHQLHRDVDIPPSDLLIHAGDWTFFSKEISAVEDFNVWLGELGVRFGKVIVPGNHEFYLEADERRRALTDEATVLIGQGTTVNGLNIWGSPVTPLYGGAFGKMKPEDRTRHYASIPENTHVLVTHGPPYGILDGLPGTGIHEGCRELLTAVERIKPRLHIFGHVHSGYGVHTTEHTTFVNAALLGKHGDIANLPLVFELKAHGE